MKKALWSGIAAALAIFAIATPAAAQSTATGSITVTVNVAARASLTLGTNAITWNDLDPATNPTLSSGPVTVNARARTGANSSVTLTVLASGDLVDGSNAIAISQLTWTGTGDLAASGTSNSGTAQSVGSWTGPGARSGSQTYSLPNSWDYAVGSYQATLTYTLTAP